MGDVKILQTAILHKSTWLNCAGVFGLTINKKAFVWLCGIAILHLIVGAYVSCILMRSAIYSYLYNLYNPK